MTITKSAAQTRLRTFSAPISAKRTLNEVEARALLAAADGNRLEFYFHLALATGARPRQLLALRWGDLVRERGVIRLERSLSRAGGTWTWSTPSVARRLVLPFPERLGDPQARHWAGQARDRLFYDHHYVDQGLVFADYTGGPLEARHVRIQHLLPTLTKAGLSAELGLESLGRLQLDG